MWYDRHPQVGKHVLFHDNGSTHYHAFFCHKRISPKLAISSCEEQTDIYNMIQVILDFP
jgi:hypothetical protein